MLPTNRRSMEMEGCGCGTICVAVGAQCFFLFFLVFVLVNRSHLQLYGFTGPARPLAARRSEYIVSTSGAIHGLALAQCCLWLLASGQIVDYMLFIKVFLLAWLKVSKKRLIEGLGRRSSKPYIRLILRLFYCLLCPGACY